jgi:uncharacterized membrane protein YqiK
MQTPTELPSLIGYAWIIPLLLALIFYKVVMRIFGIVVIPNNSVGIVDKKWALFGKNKTLPEGVIIALNGEAGVQADTLPPGLHYGYFPWQYSIDVNKFTIIEPDKIGVIVAQDGKPLTEGRVLGQAVACNSFQDARMFLANGGSRGPQISIIPPGTYRVNTALFDIHVSDVFDVPDDKVGIVVTKDGKPLETGNIAGMETPAHNMFQNGDAFITNGGYKGLQEQVILAGRYFLNPLFVDVELKDMTLVPIANVGVVISYVGNAGKDLTGDGFKHGNIVSKGEKGVWNEPYDPGKYPVNPYTHKVEIVPTANVVLNWANNKTEAHQLDKNLCTITVRSSDGYTFNLDVSQIIHIPRNDAPKVIARFGSMSNLVTQVLEPTIGSYFRNSAQSYDVIDFLKARKERQTEASKSISAALSEYNVNAVDTLIGDIVPPAELMKTLTDRKLAEQETVTYKTQQTAEENRRELEQARAMASTQANVVASERKVAIAEFDAQAAVKTAEGEAKSKTLNAAADAEVTTVNGNAEAGKVLAIGNAEATVIENKIKSMDSDNYAIVQAIEALSRNNMQIVPQIVMGGGDGKDGGGTGSMVALLLAKMLQKELVSAADTDAVVKK